MHCIHAWRPGQGRGLLRLLGLRAGLLAGRAAALHPAAQGRHDRRRAIRQRGPLISLFVCLQDGLTRPNLTYRQVNCRRSAAAALQENVGRQGNLAFPLGIELVQRTGTT